MRRCGMAATDAAHVLNKKAHPAVRFELLGLLAMCRLHHGICGDAKVVKPSALREMFIAIRGREAWDILLTLAARAKTWRPEIASALRATAEALGITLPSATAAPTARKGNSAAHSRKAPITQRPKSHQVEKQAGAGMEARPRQSTDAK